MQRRRHVLCMKKPILGLLRTPAPPPPHTPCPYCLSCQSSAGVGAQGEEQQEEGKEERELGERVRNIPQRRKMRNEGSRSLTKVERKPSDSPHPFYLLHACFSTSSTAYFSLFCIMTHSGEYLVSTHAWQKDLVGLIDEIFS